MGLHSFPGTYANGWLILVVDEFAKITFVEDCGRDDESVIAWPEDLPEGYATRQNMGC